MDFDDTPDEAAFRAAAREWLSSNAIPKGSPEDFSAGHFAGDMSPEEYVKRCRWWQGQLFEGGWAGISWPKAFGGRGGRPIEAAIFGEEQAQWGVSVGVFAVAFGMVAPTLMQHARDDQQARFLAPMLRGEELWCQLFSEPDAGSDLASLKTRAVRDGDEFVVNGQKVWTSNAQHSEWGILLARTDPDAPRHRGISYFVVDMSTPGIEIRPLRQMNGEAHFNEVFLNDVRVPAGNVIGDVDDGWKVAVTTLSNERVAIAGGSGLSDPERLLQLANQLEATSDPLFRQRFAQIWTGSEVIRYLRLRSRTALSQGRRPGPEASVMKLAYARYVKQLGDLAIGVQGAYGQLDHPDARVDGVFQQKWINAVQSSIGGGTDEIQRNIVGERVLGLPREPR
ncbi:MAG TPA: acyl-CoA dehydrogenase family protein [Acidimicrobiales bacterium]|nr:acyl-CoA dehydrogenase family protein [Acidimicrobiales bacterium]